VARLAGVSIATVSRYLNNPEKVTDKTRTKVQDAVLQTGYRPNSLAQSFRRGRTNMVMVVLPSIGAPFFAGVVHGIRKVAETRGYSILIEETDGNTITADDIGAKIASKQADGIILLASLSPFGTEVVSAKNQQALPIVIGCEAVAPELFQFPSVHIDNVAAAAEATNYLIAQRHERIAMIYGLETSLLTKDRQLGYQDAMSKAGLTVEEGWIVDGRLTIDGARKATRDLVTHERPPTAIFCGNDEMAMGCIHEIKQAGLSVPSDISVIGFDDIVYAAVLDPPLTTISQPAGEIGEKVMRRLHREIAEGELPDIEPEIVPHTLVVRQSVAPPPAG
jgi:LacI family repressor for deo operon, udp, cdd, tsx, nupC, and nupG